MSKAKQGGQSVVTLTKEEKQTLDFTRKYMLDMLFISIAPIIMAVYYYGLRVLMLVGVSVLTAVLSELFAARVFSCRSSVSDLSSVVIGVLSALCLSASAQWYVAVLVSSFAVLAVKMPFGSALGHLFSPTCAGLAFVSICLKDKMFNYPNIVSAADRAVYYGSETFSSGESIAQMLSKGNSIGRNVINYIDIFVGNVPGAMGVTCVLALIGGLVYITIRRPQAAVITSCYLLTCGVIAYLFPRVTTGRWISVFMELTAGLLLFAGITFLTNESIAPSRILPRILYGITAGVLVMLLRHVGSFEDSTVFAILLLNSFAPVFDRLPTFAALKEKALKDGGAENG